ncbi:ferredoxin [Paraclostridium bifermentans]|jgi:ferredoxin|uniref:Ferredoxin n=2 Tax=Paraclostridium bifermentans TaxID=1490 RepID=T4VNR8_PARBF|nr:ferredoxin [Paraclostridium bifermentans]RDC50188.1 ferredoxin [Acinetobacter sp. RIT592]EQK41738.1 ferredoxin [[Clostridium] bifermentans ATCC 19299] [Paraclostridium bifermentans ATCC 19299]EQK43133.1 ferredoxin [[Clostridium] bifermentans ATCC 638] [Paraclostridium bifermentans ATCC 638 = DSM 14991]MBS6510059.1 ferredoxin [Paraclostridium bifermentans]MBU5286930.1 ferredoxin [Paraclostridium bifermentans]
MKAFVDRDGCIGCQACAGTCPEVFSMDDDNISVPIKEDIPEEVLDSAKDARDGCPVSVISIK